MVSWCRGLSLQNLKAAREEKAEGQPRVVSPRPFKLLVGERQTRLPLALQEETIPRRAQALGRGSGRRRRARQPEQPAGGGQRHCRRGHVTWAEVGLGARIPVFS